MAIPIFTTNGYSYNNEPYCRVEVAEVEEGLLKFSATARRAVKAYLKKEGVPILENYAKSNHPWKNVTYSAERGLTASVYERGRANNNQLKQDYTCGIEIYHTALNNRGQQYGIYLETKYDGRYAILLETARNAGATVIEGMRNIIDKYEGSVFGVDDLDVDEVLGEIDL